MRVLICGGRDFSDHKLMIKTLLDIHEETPITCIIHGAASGADTLARNFAHFMAIPVESYPADWDKYKKAAGPIRNTKMLKEGKPEIVIAFPGGRGTADMIKQARESYVPVMEIR